MSQMSKFANTFSSVVKQAAQAAAKEKTSLEENLAKLNEQRKSLDAQVREIEKQLESIDEDVHAALVHCLRDEGIKVSSADGKKPQKSQGKTAASENDIAAVLAAIGEGKKNAMTSGQLGKAAGIEGSVASVVLRQLLDEGKIKAEGERRGKKYYS